MHPTTLVLSLSKDAPAYTNGGAGERRQMGAGADDHVLESGNRAHSSILRQARDAGRGLRMKIPHAFLAMTVSDWPTRAATLVPTHTTNG